MPQRRSVRFADNGADSDVTVLLLTPWPEGLWAFRHIWDRVSAVGRAIAIDMPGFGHSDGRPELIAPDGVALGAQSARSLRGGAGGRLVRARACSPLPLPLVRTLSSPAHAVRGRVFDLQAQLPERG